MDYQAFSGRFDELDIDTLFSELKELEACRICPRQCGVNRLKGELGYCKTGSGYYISSICNHRGEEPAISGKFGICNIFFSHCNLQCSYCQNHQISSNYSDLKGDTMDIKEVVWHIIKTVGNNIPLVGFVSASHFIPQIKGLIKVLKALKYELSFVYNSNGYDAPESIQSLEGYIDVWLPDFKYMDEDLAQRYSDAKDYPHKALSALKEMYKQCGSELQFDENGYATKGIIIRHLVLPANTENSKLVLNAIAKELSPDVHVSMMSQYYPTYKVQNDNDLGRTLNKREYNRVLDEMEKLVMYNGWIQGLDSNENYRPDFDNKHPFEL